MRRFVLIIILSLAIVAVGYLIFTNKQKSSEFAFVSLSTPLEAKPNFKYKIVGAKQAKLLFEYHYQNSYYNYDYEVDLGNETQGKISIATGPDRENIEIKITALSESGKTSNPLIFKTSQWWKRLKYDLIGHTFIIKY